MKPILNDTNSEMSILPEENNHAVVSPQLENHTQKDLENNLKKTKQYSQKQKIANSFSDIIETLGLDLKDDSLKDTPNRIAKMYVDEIFSGLNPANKPKVSFFQNKYGYNNMLIEKNIELRSICEHHFLPIIGKAHIAYFPNKKVIGLSKIHRIVDYYAKKPQLQERLTVQIAEEFKELLQTDDLVVILDAHHFCVSFRGIKDQTSHTFTVEKSGKFLKEYVYNEFLKQLPSYTYSF